MTFLLAYVHYTSLEWMYLPPDEQVRIPKELAFRQVNEGFLFQVKSVADETCPYVETAFYGVDHEKYIETISESNKDRF